MTAIDTPMTARQPGWLRIAPALFLLLWASGFVFPKLGLRYADPLTSLALHYACVVALLAGPFLWLRLASRCRRRSCDNGLPTCGLDDHSNSKPLFGACASSIYVP